MPGFQNEKLGHREFHFWRLYMEADFRFIGPFVLAGRTLPHICMESEEQDRILHCHQS